MRKERHARSHALRLLLGEVDAAPRERHRVGCARVRSSTRRRDGFTQYQVIAKEGAMFGFAIIMFLIAVLSAILGFTGLVAVATSVFKILFVVALVLAIASFVFSRLRKT